MLPTTFENEHDCLKTIYSCEHNNGNQRELTRARRNEIDEIAKIDDSSRKDKGAEEINEHNESHTEAAESAHVIQEDQFKEIVHSTIISKKLSESNLLIHRRR